MTDDTCIICEKPWNDGSLVCNDCEDLFWSDPEAVQGYFEFCGIPATIEEILEMMKT